MLKLSVLDETSRFFRFYHGIRYILICTVLATFLPSSAISEDDTCVITDLGVLAENPPGTGWSVAYSVNNESEVVGVSSTGDNYEPRAFYWFDGSPLEDLGTFPEGTLSYGTGINDNGDIIGYSDFQNGNVHAFMITSTGNFIDLGQLEPFPHPNGSVFWNPPLPQPSYPFSINNSGKIVGYGKKFDNFAPPYDPIHPDRAFYLDSSNLAANKMVDLKALKNDPNEPSYKLKPFSYAYSINDNDSIVGFSESTNSWLSFSACFFPIGGKPDPNTDDIHHINKFLVGQNWLGMQGSSFAYDVSNPIKDTVSVVGYAENTNGIPRAFIAYRMLGDAKPIRHMIDIGTFPNGNGGKISKARSLNNAGNISKYASDDKIRVFRIITPQVVGTSETSTGEFHAFIWQGVIIGSRVTLPEDFYHTGNLVASAMYDLNDLLPEDSDWVLVDAFSINDKCEIVGYGYKKSDSTRSYRAYLLKLPEVTVTAATPLAKENPLIEGKYTFTRTGSCTSRDLPAYFWVDEFERIVSECTQVKPFFAQNFSDEGFDYVTFPGQVFTNGLTSIDMKVTPIQDFLEECDEEVIIHPLLWCNNDPATVIIQDSDTDLPGVGISESECHLEARETGANPAHFRIYRNAFEACLYDPLTVYYTLSGDAVNGIDYSRRSGNVTIPECYEFVDLIITPLDDTEAECLETVTITITPHETYKESIFLDQTLTATIEDNDIPKVSVIASDAIAKEPGTNTGEFTFSRAGCGDSEITMFFNTSGSATHDVDYQMLSTSSVTIPVGSSSVTFTVTALNDALQEGDETVVVTLLEGDGYVLGPASTATVTIKDDDLTEVNVSALTPGQETGPVDGIFQLTFNPTTNITLNVNYSMTGSASNGQDYTLLSGTVSVPPGTSSMNVVADVIDDALHECIETAVFTIVDGTSYSVGAADTASITIADNDIPTVSIQATDPNASESGPESGTFNISRVGCTSSNLVVNYVVSGTAINNGTDFQPVLSGTITIPSGQSSANIVITPEVDLLTESLETVILTLSGSGSYLVGTSNSATVTILDNDRPVVVITTPANGDVFAPPATIPIAATATDLDGIANVQFFNGATLLATDSTSPYQHTWTNVPSGTYALQARGTDIRGATSNSPVVNIRVNALPSVFLNSPTNNQVFPTGAVITLGGTASDTDGTISKVDFYAGASLLGTDNSSPYGITWSTLSVGSYALKAVATDNNGGETTSALVNIRVNTPPAVSIFNPLNNAIFAAPATVVMGATASDTDGIVQVQFMSGSTSVGVDATSPYTSTWNNVGVGSYTLRAIALDGVGLSTTSNPVNFSVHEPPTVNITSPANGASFTSPATIPITASTSASVIKVAFYAGSNLLGEDTNPADGFDITWRNATAGFYTLTAVATDNIGTSSSHSITVIVRIANAPVVNVKTTLTPATETGSKGKFTITRSGGFAGNQQQPLTVFYSLGGSATNGADYAPLSGSTTIQPGSASVVVVIVPVNDAAVECDESITLTLNPSNPFYSVGSSGQASVPLIDDEPKLSIVASDSVATETGANPGEFLIKRTGSTASSLTLNYIVGGTATNGIDFNTLSGTCVIPAGASSTRIILTPINDSINEVNEVNEVNGHDQGETVEITLISPQGFCVNEPSTAVVNILDNKPLLSITAIDNIASEQAGNTGKVRVSRTGSTVNSLGVTFSVGGTATNGTDYGAIGSTKTVPSGSSTCDININPFDDASPEGNETVTITLNPSLKYNINGSGNCTVTLQDNDLPN